MDLEIIDLEESNKALILQNKKLNQEICSKVDKQLKEGSDMMTNTLKAILSVPDLNSLGPIGATILVKLRDMKNIEDVHNHIDKIFKQQNERKIL